MEHEAIRHRLSDYIDGSITDEQKDVIEKHLKSCSMCSDALWELQKTLERIKTVEESAPPAWPAQKNMSQVRDKSQIRKRFFGKWFLPLSSKPHVQAVAILFLIVAAFYAYRYPPWAGRSSEGLLQEYGANEKVPPASSQKNYIGKAQGFASRQSIVPQSPGYKTLDMKPEYGKSLPAIPLEQGEVSSPKSQDERTPYAKREAVGEGLTAAPQTRAPAMKQATGSMMRAEIKSQSENQAQIPMNEPNADKISLTVIVLVKNIEVTGNDVEQAITSLGGSITLIESTKTKKAYIVAIHAEKILELKHALKLSGEIKKETVAPMSQSGSVTLTIELLQNPTYP